VKALRNLCYFNPRDGALRDTCQITVDELAAMVGMKRATVYRLVEGNEALKAFVQKQPDAVFVEGRTRRLPPRFRVCMDTPIHPQDLEMYEALRLRKEHERAGGKGIAADEKRKSQIEIYEQRKSQRTGRKSQNGERKSQAEISFPTVVSLPSDSFNKEFLPPPAEAPSHKCVPPGGEGEEETLDPCAAAWQQALNLLAAQVNKPTYEAHLRPLRLACVSEAGEALLLAPHASTREWIEKRHKDKLEEALRCVLGRSDVTVRLSLAAPGAAATR
jgi:hypothetical protein